MNKIANSANVYEELFHPIVNGIVDEFKTNLLIIAYSVYWLAKNSNKSSFLKNHMEFKIKYWLTYW